jgi:hypothetical protein
MEFGPTAAAARGFFLSRSSDCNGYSDCVNSNCLPALFSLLKTPHFFFSHFGTVFPAGVTPAE